MNTRLKHIALVAGSALFLLACGGTSSGNHGPIVLGDSSTIVTETDPLKLKDLVTDLQPVIPPSENKEEETKEPAKDTAKAPEKPAATAATPPPAQQALPNVAGLKAEFKEVAVLVPGLAVKQAGNSNLQRANGAVYTLQSGELSTSSLRISGNVTKVSQRYQTVVVLKDEDAGTLVLEALSTTTGWQPLKGNGTYKITGLDARSLEVPDADAGDIRTAVTRAAQRRRMSRKRIQELTNDLRHVRAANQKPLTVVLRSVMWKIDGKDANGRAFSKQVRVDVPM